MRIVATTIMKMPVPVETGMMARDSIGGGGSVVER